MSNKIKVTFAIPDKMRKEMREKIAADGYSMREKSLWVSEAIDSLLENTNFTTYVSINDELSGLDKIETINIPNELKAKMSEALIKVRQTNLSLEGIQSRIIRASILQRLLRS